MLLARYVLWKKDLFFDSRNVKMAIIWSDPLAKALGVNSFHKCQAVALVRRHLIHVPEAASSMWVAVIQRPPPAAKTDAGVEAEVKAEAVTRKP